MVAALSEEMALLHPDVGKSKFEILAQMVSNLLMFGKCELLPDTEGNRKELSISPKDWLDMVQWLYNRVEGTPRQEIRQTVEGQIIFGTQNSTMFQPEDIIDGEVIEHNEMGRTNELDGPSEGMLTEPQNP